MIFIPTPCEEKFCNLHFSLHPCEGPYQEWYDGYLELAATNDIIVVYPKSNCWNADESVEQEPGVYLTKDAIYPKFIMAMIDRLTENPFKLYSKMDGSMSSNATSIQVAASALVTMLWLTY